MEEFLTVLEVAERLQRKPGTIRNWIRSGQIEVQKLPTVGKHPHYRIKKALWRPSSNDGNIFNGRNQKMLKAQTNLLRS